jgi:hypothetical protein
MAAMAAVLDAASYMALITHEKEQKENFSTSIVYFSQRSYYTRMEDHKTEVGGRKIPGEARQKDEERTLNRGKHPDDQKG